MAQNYNENQYCNQGYPPQQQQYNNNNNKPKIVWYITNKNGKYYKCNYRIGILSSILTAKMEMVVSQNDKQATFVVYKIRIPLNDKPIFFQIYQRNKDSSWKQVTHLTMNGYGYPCSNHPITKQYDDKYAWEIPKDQYVYLLDDRGNEANATMSMFYDKPKHLEYYTVVIKEFVKHLYENTHRNYYSPYLVFQTLKCIRKLLTDEQQLNWSYNQHEPGKIFISFLKSKFTFCDINDITKRVRSINDAWHCLISLFTILSTLHIQNRDSINVSLMYTYKYFTESLYIGEKLNILKHLFNNDKKLINEIKEILLSERKINLKSCNQIANYYYLLWYNLICCVYDSTEIKEVRPVIFTQVKLKTDSINLYDLLYIIELDQRLCDWPNRAFLLTDLLMDQSHQTIAHLKKNKVKLIQQSIFFEIINTLKDVNDLYHVLIKHGAFIFETVIGNDYEVLLKFVSCMFQKIKTVRHVSIESVVLNGFCIQILSVSNKQYSDKLYTLYCEWKQFMNSSLINNAILQNEYLIAQERFISICSPMLRSKNTNTLQKCMVIWLKYFSLTKISELFDKNKFKFEPLIHHLANHILCISNKGNADELYALCCSYRHFMNSSLINNAILQTEYLIAQQRFISICAPILRSMNTSSLQKYVSLWWQYFSVTKLYEIFVKNKFNSQALINHLAKLLENEKIINKQQLLDEKQKHMALNNKYTLLMNETFQITAEQKELERKYNELEAKYNDIEKQNESKNDMIKQIQTEYDKLSNVEQKYKKLKVKHDALEDDHKELELKFNKIMDELGYKSWDAKRITNWIVDLDKLRYNKYYDELLTNMKNEGIDGRYICDLELNDLHRFGITHFKDKKDIYNSLQQLIHNKRNQNQNQKMVNGDELDGYPETEYHLH